ncbi:MAG: response regulator [bacterium]|jgi:CheY-like chemotaxis protein|nr:response regulator [bacterium]
MSEQPGANKPTTRHLIQESVPKAVQRGTGPLDYMMPWVIELRVVGTASVIQSEVSESVTLGRSDKEKRSIPDVDLADFNAYYMGVSRQHAVICARNSRITIRDLNSANGTYINNARLEPELEYRLRHGDHLTLGKLQLQVFFVVTPSSYEKNETSFSEITIPHIGSDQLVLIVDDDAKVANAIGAVLQEAGFRTHLVRNVAEAIALVESARPSAIVTELILPDMNGLELVRYIRTREVTQEIPLIVISSVTGGYQMGKAIEAGVDIFLTKPLGVDELMRSFSKIVQHMRV